MISYGLWTGPLVNDAESRESANPLYETVLTLAWSDSGRRKRDLRKSWASAGWRYSPFSFCLRDAWQSRVSSAGITGVTGERTEQPNQRPSRCTQFTEKTETKLLMNTVGAYWSLFCLMHEAQHKHTHTHFPYRQAESDMRAFIKQCTLNLD